MDILNKCSAEHSMSISVERLVTAPATRDPSGLLQGEKAVTHRDWQAAA